MYDDTKIEKKKLLQASTVIGNFLGHCFNTL